MLLATTKNLYVVDNLYTTKKKKKDYLHIQNPFTQAELC